MTVSDIIALIIKLLMFIGLSYLITENTQSAIGIGSILYIFHIKLDK